MAKLKIQESYVILNKAKSFKLTRGDIKMKILNFGSLNIDKVYSVPYFVQKGETLGITNYAEYAGGKGLNQSISLAKSGACVYHAGKIGKDGLWLKEKLEKEGVNTEFISEEGSLTGHAIIQVTKEGENNILLFGGANKEITKADIDETLSNFSNEDVLVLQNEISNLKYLVEKANKIGMKIVFNPSPLDEHIKNIDFSKITYLIMNEIEATYIFGLENLKKTIEHIKKNYPNLKVVITLGERGSIYISKEIKCKQDIFKTNVVDTTAAGDTFLGFFISQILISNNPKKSLEIASKASSIAVSKNGASDSIPSLNQLGI